MVAESPYKYRRAAKHSCHCRRATIIILVFIININE